MGKDLKNPFEKEEVLDPPKRNSSFRTVYYDLLQQEHRANLETDLNTLVNNGNKYSITTFMIGTKVDGAPYIFTRYRNDLDLEDKNLGWFTINVRMFAPFQFADMDTIINTHDNTVVRLLAEKHFVYKTGEIVVLLVWADISSTSRTQEALSAIRSAFAR